MKVIQHAQGSPEWFAYRERRISGSTVAAILGESKYSTPLNEWARIMGRLVKREEKPNAYADFGLLTEDAHRLWIEDERAGWAVWATDYIVCHPTLDYGCCSPDGLAYDEDAAHPILVELKAPSAWTAGEWDERLPLAYQIQLQWNMLCADAPTGLLSVILPPKESMTALTALSVDLMRRTDGVDRFAIRDALRAAGWTRRDYDIEADRELQSVLTESVAAWWATYVEQGIAPEATGHACDKAALGDINAGGSVDLDFDEAAVAKVEELGTVQAQIKALTADEERLKNQLTQKAGASTWMEAKKAINAARRMVG